MERIDNLAYLLDADQPIGFRRVYIIQTRQSIVNENTNRSVHTKQNGEDVFKSSHSLHSGRYLIVAVMCVMQSVCRYGLTELF